MLTGSHFMMAGVLLHWPNPSAIVLCLTDILGAETRMAKVK